ncbi:hypothetical protein [Salmonella enterica]|uniref:hypothetical protein n=1 Tax=Salmonella enterica TaxID=28901 RepID=UPI001C5DB9FC|nr:hypothetical protein [Salmonella enterica]
MLYEIDARLQTNESGVIIAEGSTAAWMARLDEWLRTPEGSVYGLPSWGNPMEEFKHEPFGSETSHIVEVAIEGRMMKKLRQDLPGLDVQGFVATRQVGPSMLRYFLLQ